MSPQQQIIYLAEAERMFAAFEKIPRSVWEEEQEKYDELTKYLNSAIPNYDDFIMEIYAQFEDEYLENFEN